MSATEGSARFAESAELVAKVTAYITAAMPGATLVELGSVFGDGGVALSGHDETDTRPTTALVNALESALRADGWESAWSADGGIHRLRIARAGGAGEFRVQPSVITFDGVPGHGGPGAEPVRVAELRQALSDDIRAAIRSATPNPVYPRDDFEDGGARIAGWDPEERRSNEALLDEALRHLAARGWEVTPETTDSEDRSARIARPGLASGRLYAANRGLTFTGRFTAEP